MPKKNLKIVHDEKYDKTKILLANPAVQNKIRSIKKDFLNLGCPLPKGGLKTNEDYKNWHDKYYDCRNKKKEYSNFYVGKLDEILKENNLWAERTFYLQVLKNYLFFNKKEAEIVPTMTKVTFNKNTRKMELYVQIFPHTSQEDVINFWPIILREKKYAFAKNKTKNKLWEMSGRDIKICEIDQKLERMGVEERRRKYNHGSVATIILENSDLWGLGTLSPEIIRAARYKVKKKKAL